MQPNSRGGYRKAVAQDLADAQTNLGSMYENGQGGLVKNETMAVTLYRKAAEQGLARGQYRLGLMYENGRGVTKDTSEALKLYRKAAAQNYEHAERGVKRLGGS